MATTVGPRRATDPDSRFGKLPADRVNRPRHHPCPYSNHPTPPSHPGSRAAPTDALANPELHQLGQPAGSDEDSDSGSPGSFSGSDLGSVSLSGTAPSNAGSDVGDHGSGREDAATPAVTDIPAAGDTTAQGAAAGSRCW